MSNDSLALDFKSATLYAVRVVLHEADTVRLIEALDKRMSEAGSFFENEPVVIDAARLEGEVDWAALIEALRSRKLPPIGVVAEGAVLAAAVQAGLAPVELSTPAPRPAPAENGGEAPALVAPATATVTVTAPEPEPEPKPGNGDEAPAAATPAPAPAAEAVPAMVVNRPLRSGQRVYARHADLIVVGMVSQGAEVIADGNIHIYGPLRGKAMAGARGDTSARIFTTQLDPELLAVAGVYRVVESRLDSSLHNRPAQIRLEEETLKIEAL